MQSDPFEKLDSSAIADAGPDRITHESEEAARHRQAALISSLTVRALNHDNQVETRRVAALYEHTYGAAYPFPNVYDPLFWSRQTDAPSRNRWPIDLVAVDRRSFVGHLGLRFDKPSGLAELSFVALAPQCREQIFSISRAAWKIVRSVAAEQKWQGVYNYCPASHLTNQLISVKCFHSRELAILPGYVPAAKTAGSAAVCGNKRVSVLVMHSPMHDQVTPPAVLYPPERHADFIGKLYASIGVPVCLSGTKSPGQTFPGMAAAAAAGEQSSGSPEGMSIQYRRRFATYNILLQPSRINDTAQVLSAVKNLAALRRWVYLQLALDDPQCPQFCRALEECGFRFSGILPPVVGRHCLVYSQFNNEELERIALYSAQAKELRDYMTQALIQ
jgi:hypothetical protein